MISTPKIDLPVLYYKIFLVLIFLAQIYPLIFGVGNNFTLICNGVVAIYIMFRYYMLTKLKGDASIISMTVTEFLILNRQQIKKINESDLCDKCKFKI